MDGPLIILLAALLAAPFSLAWVEMHRHLEDVAARRRACDHEWSDPFPVDPGGRGVIGYKAKCPLCGEQKNVNIDGTDYVPEWQRPRRG